MKPRPRSFLSEGEPGLGAGFVKPALAQDSRARGSRTPRPTAAKPILERKHVRGDRTDQPGIVYHIRTSTLDGCPWFDDPECTRLFLECLFDWRKRLAFKLFAFVVMPEHVHLLLMPGEAAGLRKIMMNLKRNSAWRLNRLLARRGPFWRDEFFDHWPRTSSQLAKTIEYLHENPVRRELVAKPEDYPYSSWLAWHSPEQCPYQLDLDWL